jgi:Flp pilus assembly protein TadG
MTWRARGDSGSVALEAAILIPAVLVVGLLVIAAGRVAHARDEVQTVAAQAARAASLSRTLPAAQAAASTEAEVALRSEGTTCAAMRVQVSGDFARPVGAPASVRVLVVCRVALSTAAFPGLPGSKTLTASSVAPLDAYRGRS